SVRLLPFAVAGVLPANNSNENGIRCAHEISFRQIANAVDRRRRPPASPPNQALAWSRFRRHPLPSGCARNRKWRSTQCVLLIQGSSRTTSQWFLQPAQATARRQTSQNQ